jgi:hypothetical protein
MRSKVKPKEVQKPDAGGGSLDIPVPKKKSVKEANTINTTAQNTQDYISQETAQNKIPPATQEIKTPTLDYFASALSEPKQIKPNNSKQAKANLKAQTPSEISPLETKASYDPEAIETKLDQMQTAIDHANPNYIPPEQAKAQIEAQMAERGIKNITRESLERRVDDAPKVDKEAEFLDDVSEPESGEGYDIPVDIFDNLLGDNNKGSQGAPTVRGNDIFNFERRTASDETPAESRDSYSGTLGSLLDEIDTQASNPETPAEDAEEATPEIPRYAAERSIPITPRAPRKVLTDYLSSASSYLKPRIAKLLTRGNRTPTTDASTSPASRNSKQYIKCAFIGAAATALLLGYISCSQRNTKPISKGDLYRPTPIKNSYDYSKKTETTKIGNTEYFWVKIDPNNIQASDPNNKGAISTLEYFPVPKEDLVKNSNTITKETRHSSRKGLEAFVETTEIKGLIKPAGKDNVVSYDFKDGKTRILGDTSKGIVMIENPRVNEYADGKKDYFPQPGENCYLLSPVQPKTKTSSTPTGMVTVN